ncbi:hypothetical protein TRFO_37353 [Tritrichomonas foetus]|uniref:Lipoprotein n=1 Tax=Tritrichomonas foetus TaxID=1144522 RepID=A0A1J4JBE7_9EUKA|nr:hypothetical protein TRFO_37353 [Tritrichomonas foetus]|eukprot:OHS96464.1 hypothetical protein TRFO_37353 [Tritrichomonas foetus]
MVFIPHFSPKSRFLRKIFMIFLLFLKFSCELSDFKTLDKEIVKVLDSFEIYPPAGTKIKLLLTNISKIGGPKTFYQNTKKVLSYLFNKKKDTINNNCENCFLFDNPFALFTFAPQNPSKTYYISIPHQQIYSCSPNVLKFTFLFKNEVQFKTDFINITSSENTIHFGDQKIKFDKLEVEAFNNNKDSEYLCLSPFHIVS